MAQDKAAITPSRDITPDRRKLNTLQAQRLGEMARIDAKQLVGQTVAELSEKFKWQIDPEHFFFRKVCGQVVKKDPATGVEYPVPFATVIVEDTDCSLLGYFPKNWQWGWFFPLNCHREVLATVKTDKCGRFCVHVPRFDIEWILRWRRERICFPDIFVRPDLGDLIDPRDPLGPFPPRPGPGPDPAPLDRLGRFANLSVSTVEALGGADGRRLARSAAALQASRSFGGPAGGLAEAAQRRAFAIDMPPPLPLEFQQVLTNSPQVVAGKGAKALDAVRGTIAAQLGIEPNVLERLDLGRYAGPFRRCRDIFVPEWHVIVDTPDISFRVTQDTNGDGVEETIYAEGYFDVRWNAGHIRDVTLVASSAARESRLCDTPVVPCKDVPELLFAGLMPLTNPAYFDASATQGYALRPNRPLPPGPRPAAKTPFLGTLQLYGCVNVPKAAFYRVLASTGGGAFAAITGLSWNIYPVPFGAPHLVAPDASGWYPVLANPGSFHPANLVLEWPTPTLGQYKLKIELADAAKASLGLFSNVVPIQVDNTVPNVLFNRLAWRFAGEPDSAFDLPDRNLLVPCPTIRRGAPALTIEIQFDVAVSAHHLRDAALGTHGCGGGSSFTLISAPAATAHWHQTVLDNAVLLSGRYQLLNTALEGAYGFNCQANSRAMNPAGSDNGHLLDWLYDPVYRYARPEVEVAIVNG
jgi:hypothetical protein